MSVDNKSVIVCWLLHLAVKTLIIITQFLIIYCDVRICLWVFKFLAIRIRFCKFRFRKTSKVFSPFKPNEWSFCITYQLVYLSIRQLIIQVKVSVIVNIVNSTRFLPYFVKIFILFVTFQKGSINDKVPVPVKILSIWKQFFFSCLCREKNLQISEASWVKNWLTNPANNLKIYDREK